MNNLSQKETKNGNHGENLEVQMLLHDHAQSSEDARYRDTLILHGFYFSLAILAGLIAVIVSVLPEYWLCAVISLISAVIFLVYSISLRKISSARNAAWANRARIEKAPRLKGLVNVNRWIVDRLGENGQKRDKDWWERRSAGSWVWHFELGVCIGSALFILVFILLQIVLN